MYVIEVIPLTNLPPNVPQLLDYFFHQELQKGAVTEVFLNNRKVNAIVASSTLLEKQKISLKNSNFQLKKLSKVISVKPQVSDYQFKIAVWLSQHYYASLGQCLKTVLPPFFLKKKYVIEAQKAKVKNQGSTEKPKLILSSSKDTLKGILPHIKEGLKRGQVLLITPELSTINYFTDKLQKYIPIKIYSGNSNKHYFETWKKVSSDDSQLIIGTRQALFLPFNKLELIIIDDLNHEAYKSDMSPKYNTRHLANKIAYLNGCKMIFTSVMPSIGTYLSEKRGELEVIHPKTNTQLKTKIVDLVNEIKADNFSPLSKELQEQMISTVKQKNKCLIFVPRRGYAGILLCENCGLALRCSNCDIAMKIHLAIDKVLACHHCGKSKRYPDHCPNCNSYKLKSSGPAGTQKIYERTKNLLNNNNIKAPILALDTDIVKNDVEENEIIKEICDSSPSVLIATSMIFSHRYESRFDLIGITNVDAMTNTPEFNTEEKFFTSLKKLKDFEPRYMIIQTHHPDNQMVNSAISEDYVDFYEKEAEVRKILWYPPFARLIKLTYKHKNKQKCSYAARTASEKLKTAVMRNRLENKIMIIDASPAFIERQKGLFVYNIIIKIRPDENIKNILRYTPPGWLIDVDPVAIL
jgi:primosomal protein N' (replication factor Y) (superfamily II helicase)